MRLAIISRREARSEFIIQRVTSQWPDHLVIRPVRQPKNSDESRKQRMARRLRKLGRHPFLTVSNQLDQIAHKIYDWYEGDVNQRICDGLSRDVCETSVPVNCVDVAWREVNSAATEHLLRSFTPDILLVSAAPILRENIFSIPRLGAINIHSGLLPQYRGEHTLFWPLYFEDYEQIGVTVHQIDAGIDTGAILVRGRPEIAPCDGESDVAVKATRLAARLILETLSVAGTAMPDGHRQQTSAGREFRNRERTGWKELRYLARRDLLGCRTIATPESVEWFFDRTSIDLEESVLREIKN